MFRIGLFGNKTVIAKKDKEYRAVAFTKLNKTRGSGDIRNSVRLPPGEDLNEWLAINVIDFFKTANNLYGFVSDYCSDQTCPKMNAGSKFEYKWSDGVKVKKPIDVSAPEYVRLLMEWIDDTIEDETIFVPDTSNAPFPKKFLETVKTIMKKLFRVYAHIYYSHLEKIIANGLEVALNSSFQHFYLFIREFNLVDPKEVMIVSIPSHIKMSPLEELIAMVNKKYPVEDPQPTEQEKKPQTVSRTNSSNNNNSNSNSAVYNGDG